MSRTDELRGRGARDRTGGGGGAPFVDWKVQPPAWIEGRVMKLWESQYGPNVTIEVKACSRGLQAKDKDEDGRDLRVEVEPGMEVNIGLNYAALEGTVHDEDYGAVLHFAYEEDVRSQRTGNTYKKFAVLEVPDLHRNPDAGNPVASNAGYNAPADDDLPF